MLILLFTVLVIAMTVLVMYKKEKNALRRMMARGRCGLPGRPNLTFNVPPNPWAEGCDEDGNIKDKDPFDSQLKTLAKIIVEKRKQITDSKGRVNNAEDILRNLHTSSISLRRKYQSIMDDLRGELESAELECQDLNKFVGKANELKQKFFSPDDDDGCGESNAVGLPGRVTEEQWGSLPLCSSGAKKKTKYTCHPPVQKPNGQSSISSCKCPSGSQNPLSTCIPPLPSCCPKKPRQNSGSNQSISSCSQSITQYRSDPSVSSCCNPPQPSSNPNSLPCPPPLPSLLPKKMSSDCSAMLNLPSPNNSKTSCCQPSETVSRSSSLSRNPLDQRCPPRPPLPGCPPCQPCPPPQCMCDCDELEPQCPSTTYIRKPPFSSFFQERMSSPVQRRSFKQTVVTEECIGGDKDETTSWLEPNTIVTEVRTSSVTFPPNCCLTAYEEFLGAAVQSQPKPEIKLPVIVDECDPCADIPRQISPWEDTENVTHSCGTQTKEEEEEERRQSDQKNRHSL